MQTFCIFSFDWSSISHFFFDSSFLIGFQVRPDCQKVRENNFKARSNKISSTSESKSEDIIKIYELRPASLGGVQNFNNPGALLERSEDKGPKCKEEKFVLRIANSTSNFSLTPHSFLA